MGLPEWLSSLGSSRHKAATPREFIAETHSHPVFQEIRDLSRTRGSVGFSTDFASSIAYPGAEREYLNHVSVGGPSVDEQPRNVVRKPAPRSVNGPGPNQQEPGDQEIENMAWPKKKKSLGTFRKAFMSYEKDKAFQSQHRQLFDYVQELQRENVTLTTSSERLNTDVDFLKRTFLQIYTIIQKSQPGLIQDVRENTFAEMPDYLDGLLTSYRDQLNKLDAQFNELEKKKEEIRDLNAGIADLKIALSNTQKFHQKNVEILRAKYDERILLQKTEFETKLNVQNLDSKSQFTRQANDHALTIKSMTAQHDALVNQLQNDLLTTVDGFEPLTDSDCSKQINVLRSLIHTLAFQHTPFDSQRLGQSFDQVAFIQSNPEKRGHKFILEARIWEIISSEVFSTPFKALGQYGETFTACWIRLFRNKDGTSDSTFIWPEPSSRSEMWRYVTFETLRNDLMGTQPAGKLRDSYETHMAKTRAAISEAFSRVFSDYKETEIWKIVDKAFLLAFDFGIQRCRLQFFAPSPGELISTRDPKTHVDLNKGNEEGLSQGEVQLAIRPGVRRIGDGRGGSFATVTNISSAGVYLRKTS